MDDWRRWAAGSAEVTVFSGPQIVVQQKRSSPSPDLRHLRAQEVLWSDSLCNPGWVDARLAVVNTEMGGRAITTHRSLSDGRDPCGPSGYQRCVMGETVSRLCKQGQITEAVEALGLLVRAHCHVSQSLFYAVLKKCTVERDLVLGRRVHAVILKGGYQSDTFLCNHIMRMYVSHSRLEEAMDVFVGVANPDAFTWSAIISALFKHGRDKEAIGLYHRMRMSSVKPDGHVFVAALQACARGGDLETGLQVHADVLATGVEPDSFVCNSLVAMYAKCGSLVDARRVFDRLSKKNVVTWTALIAGYSQQGMGQEAFSLFGAMQEEGMTLPDAVTFLCLLQACASVGATALEKGRQLHSSIKEQGHEGDVFVASSLVNMYAKCGSVDDALRVFDGIEHKDVVTWSAMIAGYSQQGRGQEALRLYSDMREEGIVVLDSVTFLCLLQACASVGAPALEEGKQLHAQIREQGLQADDYVASSLVSMYSKCGSVHNAQRVFDALSRKDAVTWSAMIAGYAQQGMGEEALRLYSMLEESIRAVDSETSVCLLQACAIVGTAALEKGRQLHAKISEVGLQADEFVANSLISMYARCGSVEDARIVFDALARKDVVTWNSLIAGFSQQAMGQEALHLCEAMQKEGIVTPNSGTFVCLLQACASVGSLALDKGKQLHDHIREQGLQGDVFVGSSLVNMYTKCGSVEDARSVFDGLSEKNVVTWNAMLSGYSQQGLNQEALHLYRDMQEEGMAAPDSVTFVCLLKACAGVAALHVGRQLHAQIEDQGLQADVTVGNSLITMYANSGSMVDAQQVFDALPKRDVITWNALIAGYTCEGNSERVFDLVRRMREDGTQPDSIVLLAVLTVCSHTGLVNKGQEYFNAMSMDFGITPTLEHYACMVDLLCRSGQVHESLALARTMPVSPNASVWHTVLGACRKWGNVEVGCHAFREAVKLNQKDAAAYVLMSNVYSAAQMWEQAQKMQTERVGIGAWKQPGQSWWTDTEGRVHNFLVGDTWYLGNVGTSESPKCRSEL